MANNDITLSINEVEDRISEIISSMYETEKRELLERLEKWEQSGYENGRKHPRKQTSIYAIFSGPDCYFREFIKDISAGGLYIETDNLLVINQELTITFYLPDAKAPMKIKGKVVRTDSKGIGINFNEILSDI